MLEPADFTAFVNDKMLREEVKRVPVRKIKSDSMARHVRNVLEFNLPLRGPRL